MRTPATILGLALILACGPREPKLQGDEWERIQDLERMSAASDGASNLDARQGLADALHEFIQNNPDHVGAGKMYENLEIEFARELAARGRLTAAAIHYESVLARNPGNREAAEELAIVDARRRLSPEIVEQLRPGMTPEEVEDVLGPPPPGWKRSLSRDGQVTESWSYHGASGTITVHFVNGELLTIDP